jgi:hypothetical protein
VLSQVETAWREKEEGRLGLRVSKLSTEEDREYPIWEKLSEPQLLSPFHHHHHHIITTQVI